MSDEDGHTAHGLPAEPGRDAQHFEDHGSTSRRAAGAGPGAYDADYDQDTGNLGGS